ncbi:uncharacterized protein MELLADRAFT_111574 [Melampsora larici-populina 98AG31]|uniref:Uncharacterized protein n=1 Tax=Melampsora larici-populina (strain 98AG31 / pathotype 3-4-7) TaxID=747676 RepID=F4S3M8_MELLP|nr:uncharacterized protein MELLADRAFT_111574 [Melampsora larici-populina 98AG31]EGG00769.1 hypothetical protein MELLADRAFT_111574 [Melampsora larici-populina 98AG31]
MPSSQSHVDQSTSNPNRPSKASQPQHLCNPPSNPGMILPSPDSQRCVSVNGLPGPSQCTSSSTVLERVNVTTEDDNGDGDLENSTNKGNSVQSTDAKETKGFVGEAEDKPSGTGSAFVTQKTLHTDSEEENGKVQARGQQGDPVKTEKFRVNMVNCIISKEM